MSTKPTQAFVMVGINDIYADVSVDDIMENYVTLVKSLTDAGIEVFIQSTIQCEENVCGANRVKNVNNLNERLRLLSEQRNLAFVDLGALSEKTGLERKYTTDGVHLTFEGYKYWTNVLKPFVVNKR